MKPIECPLYEKEFDKRPLLQAKAIHTAKAHGADKAERIVNEALEGTHDDHAGYFEPSPNPIV